MAAILLPSFGAELHTVVQQVLIGASFVILAVPMVIVGSRLRGR